MLRRIARFGLWLRGKLRVVVDERLQLLWRDLPGIELIAEVGDHQDGNVDWHARDVLFEVFYRVQLRVQNRMDDAYVARIEQEKAGVASLIDVDVFRVLSFYA